MVDIVAMYYNTLLKNSTMNFKIGDLVMLSYQGLGYSSNTKNLVGKIVNTPLLYDLYRVAWGKDHTMFTGIYSSYELIHSILK